MYWFIISGFRLFLSESVSTKDILKYISFTRVWVLDWVSSLEVILFTQIRCTFNVMIVIDKLPPRRSSSVSFHHRFMGIECSFLQNWSCYSSLNYSIFVGFISEGHMRGDIIGYRSFKFPKPHQYLHTHSWIWVEIFFFLRESVL